MPELGADRHVGTVLQGRYRVIELVYCFLDGLHYHAFAAPAGKADLS